MKHNQIICDLNDSFANEEAVEKLISIGLQLPLKGISTSPFWIKKIHRELKDKPLILQVNAGSFCGNELSYMKLFLMKELIKLGANDIISTFNIGAFRTNPKWARMESLQLSEAAHNEETFHTLRIPNTLLLDENEVKEIAKICNTTGVDSLLIQELHLPYLNTIKNELSNEIELSITTSDLTLYKQILKKKFDTVNLSFQTF